MTVVRTGRQPRADGKRTPSEEVAMSRTIDLRRHTDNDGDVLSPEGVAAAVALGEALEGDIAFAVSTGAQRATQTLACALGATTRVRVPCGVLVEAKLRSAVEDRWKAAVKATGDARMTAVRAVDAELVDDESARLGAGLRRVLEQLGDGNRALVIGHSPTNEAAVLGLTGQEVEPMGTGAGVRLSEHNGVFSVAALATVEVTGPGHERDHGGPGATRRPAG